ncbi:MAG TPA: hypothetical protein QF528_05315, partial [Phycisphaerales bacterium]|nr:hypothetical protein [Phycisphaerales bacterium]
TLITSILGAFMFLGVFFAGIGTVMIARWFWWRVNAFTELVAIVATIIVASATLIWIPDTERVLDIGRLFELKIFSNTYYIPYLDVIKEPTNKFGLRVLVTTFSVLIIWVPIAFITSTKPDKPTIAFHNKMQIGGVGWNAISKVPAELTAGIYEWIIVMALLLCILLGTGKLLFHEWLVGAILIAFATLLFIPFMSILKRAKLH